MKGSRTEGGRPGHWRYALHAAVLVGLVVAATKYSSGKEFLRVVLIGCSLISALWFDAARKPALGLLAARSPELLILDRSITRAVQRGRVDWLDPIALGFTFLGNGGTLVVSGLGAAVLLLASGRPWASLLCAATLLGLPLNMCGPRC